MLKLRDPLLILIIVLLHACPVQAHGWVHPTTQGDRPVWGVDGGIEIGIAPTPGPRGLIRIYTPYLHMSADQMINFIAVEPIAHGKRDLSEMQKSKVDHVAGKHIDAADHLEDSLDRGAQGPAQGVVDTANGIEQMSLYLRFEPFDNGAHVSLKVTFHADKPDEVVFQTIAAPDSAPMESCVLTATMGNYAILRHLRLRDRTVEARDLFAGEKMGFWNFYPWHQWAATELIHDHGQLRIDVTGDGNASKPTTTPATEEAAVLVPKNWRYAGESAEQSWSTADRPGVVARANGRQSYWGSKAAIPGGVAFENVELAAPFEAGQAFTFRVTPQTDHQ